MNVVSRPVPAGDSACEGADGMVSTGFGANCGSGWTVIIKQHSSVGRKNGAETGYCAIGGGGVALLFVLVANSLSPRTFALLFNIDQNAK